MLCPIVTKESIFMEMTFLKLNVEFYFTVFLIIRNELYVRIQKKYYKQTKDTDFVELFY
jgi:hypothetical protein